MHARAAVVDFGYIQDEIVSICHRYNRNGCNVKQLIDLSGHLISDLVVNRFPSATTLPPSPQDKHTGLLDDDDLYKIGKYIIIGELLENNVPYGQIIRLIKILEESIMTCLSEYDINLRDIVKVDIIQTTAILWVL